MELSMEMKELDCVFPGEQYCVPLEGSAECIVPDALPDVLEILRCACTVAESSVRTAAESVFLTASVEVCVLYRSEEGTREVIRLTVPLQGEVKGNAPEEEYTAELFLRRTEGTAPNSRKISVHLSGELCLCPLLREKVSLPVGVPGAEGLELDTRELTGSYVKDIALRDFSFTEELELPAACPNAKTVLGVSATAREVESRLIPGKAVIKALIDYRLWYLAEEGIRETVFSMPFSQILELPSAEEEDVARVSVSIAAISLREEEAGRTYSVTLSGKVRAALLGKFSARILADAYSTREQVTAEGKSLRLWYAEDESVREATVREELECTGRVLSAAVESLGIQQTGEKVTVEAAVTLLVDDGDGAVPASRRVSVELPISGQLLFPWISVSDVSFVPTAAGAEVRCRLLLSGTELTARETRAIAKLTTEGPRPDEHLPALTLRRVHPGERYFDIGRSYCAPLEELFAANGLEPVDAVTTERMLIIPRKS